jgi:PIN domain nuclease of toxin-antitoxin system
MFIDSRHTLYLSSVSVWELVIKTRLGRLRLPESPASYITSRMTAGRIEGLPVSPSHILRAESLPDVHHDAFDRILIAQAQTEALTLLSVNPVFERYKVRWIWGGRERAKP